MSGYREAGLAWEIVSLGCIGPVYYDPYPEIWDRNGVDGDWT
jgi:hypothetical protein